ncbi:hypothetical protein C0991_005455 [Blastosporella zonata]|nr:hypothetical protein C0991_005455 [Blastosporella zonata]
MSDEQISLPSPPFDSISSVRYSPTNPDHLLVSSWDTTVRLYEVGNKTRQTEAKAKFEHRAPVLACCFSDASHAFSGGLDTSVRELDLGTENMRNLGAHNDAISTMAYFRESNMLITGSWDRTLRFWDSRANSPQHSSHDTPERVYQLDLVNNTLVVAMASRLFNIYDVRKMDSPIQQRESSLKFMTRSLACMPDGQGYATASVEGRIAVEYFDPSPAAQEKKYAFKCHRQTIDDVDHVWPVNALAFHPTSVPNFSFIYLFSVYYRYNTFASAGSDATVSIWDHKVKKRLRQYSKFASPISSLAFNCDGTKLAIAVSYTWDDGEQGLKTAERPAVFVRTLGDEVKVLNEWSNKGGLVVSQAAFHDVYGLDPELLCLVPRPVKAVVLLFPITEQLETKRKAEDEKIKNEGQPLLDPTVVWIKQTIPNACGTIGLLHALANSNVTFSPQSPLAQFIDQCKDKTPEERATLLETTPLFANIHADAASSGQTVVPDNLDTDLHFTCFVRAPAVRGEPESPGGHRVIELDGRRVGPVDRGECGEDLLEDVVKAVRMHYLSNTTSVQFNMIVLGPGEEVYARG